MRKLTGFGGVAVNCAIAGLIYASSAAAQTEGALQYPPASVGEDAQPPPPARTVPQSISPRRIELGIGGSSQGPANQPFRVHPPGDIRPPAKNPTAAGN